MGKHLDVLREIIVSCPESLRENCLFMFGSVLIHKAGGMDHLLPDEDDEPLVALRKQQQLDNTKVLDMMPHYTWEEIEAAINRYGRLGMDEGFLVTSLLLIADELYEGLAGDSDDQSKKENLRELIADIERDKRRHSEDAERFDKSINFFQKHIDEWDDKMMENKENFKTWRSIAGERVSMRRISGRWDDCSR